MAARRTPFKPPGAPTFVSTVHRQWRAQATRLPGDLPKRGHCGSAVGHDSAPGNLAKALSATGRYDDALEIATAPSKPAYRDTTRNEVAIAAARAGHIALSLRNLRQRGNPERRWALARIRRASKLDVRCIKSPRPAGRRRPPATPLAPTRPPVVPSRTKGPVGPLCCSSLLGRARPWRGALQGRLRPPFLSLPLHLFPSILRG